MSQFVLLSTFAFGITPLTPSTNSVLSSANTLPFTSPVTLPVKSPVTPPAATIFLFALITCPAPAVRSKFADATI